MQDRFNPRVAAIAIARGKVLLSRMRPDDFWSLPGGRIKAGEMSDAALVRELAEELGVSGATVGRLIFVVENHFAHNEVRFREIGFYYQVDLPEGLADAPDGEFASAEAGLLLRWFDLSDLAGADLRPSFLRDRLGSLPAGIEHLRISKV